MSTAVMALEEASAPEVKHNNQSINRIQDEMRQEY